MDTNITALGKPNLTSFEKWEVVLLALVQLIVILFATFGNLLTIIAIITQRSLHTPPNVLILSLALTDVIVGAFIFPLSAGDDLMGYRESSRWYFGSVLCRMYLTIGITVCGTSSLHIAAIAVDRYRCINEGLEYICNRTFKGAIKTSVALWLLALSIGSAPLLGWNNWDGVDDLHNQIGGVPCTLPPKDIIYSILSVTFAIFIPGIVMIVVYIKIVIRIRERLRERAAVFGCTPEVPTNSTEELEEQNISSAKPTKESSGQITNMVKSKMKFSLKKERKAARVVGIIFAAFLICLLPFAIVFLTGGICIAAGSNCISANLLRVVTRLACVNSALNPIIYAVFNREFREAFKKVLKFKRY